MNIGNRIPEFPFRAREFVCIHRFCIYFTTNLWIHFFTPSGWGNNFSENGGCKIIDYN